MSDVAVRTDPRSTYTRYMAAGYGTRPAQGVDRELGIIRGVSVCTAGEAKGHGVHLDSEFIEEVARLGSEREMGLKCRFGHPNMCNEALGTHVGWFKNFSVIRNELGEATQVIADLHISPTADSSPNGKLGTYVMDMGAKEDQAFGTSIVFTPGALYFRHADGAKVPFNWDDDDDDEELSDELYVECESLHACDAVDEPAANEGLFSVAAYGQGEIAAAMTEFLDLHPQITSFARGNPNLVQQFLSRYVTSSPTKPEQKDPEMGSPKKQAGEVATDPAKTPPAVEPAALNATPVEPAAPEPPQEPTPLSELNRAIAAFGAEVATAAFGAGGGYAEAQDLAFKNIQEENVQLKARVEALSKGAKDPIPLGNEPATGEIKTNTLWGED